MNVTSSYLRYQTNMDRYEVFSLNSELELPEGFYKGHSLNVSYCTTQLNFNKRIYVKKTGPNMK